MKRSTFLRTLLTGALVAPNVVRAVQPSTRRKLVLIAGRPSHPPMMHEHRAGNLLLAKRLREVPGLEVECHDMGWVRDETTFADADAIAIFADGGGGHPAIQADRLTTLGRLIQRGAGFGCIHYAVEVPKDRGANQFRDWIGGCYEHEWSCNPMWTASYDSFPKHPVTQGVAPFAIHDEWYFNMRFRQGFDAEGPRTVDGIRFTPILVDRPSDATRDGPYVWPQGPYPHIQAARGRKETVMWTVERPDGGRGFGFTGGHFHKNWQDDNFRKIVLNALVWIAKVDLPLHGIDSAPVSNEELAQNLDPK